MSFETMDELEASLGARCRDLRAGAEALQARIDSGEVAGERRDILQRLVTGTLNAVDAFERLRDEKGPPAEEPASES